MPGTLWPCWLLVGESIAPEPTIRDIGHGVDPGEDVACEERL